MIRGIARRAILRDDRDRAHFLRRVAALAQPWPPAHRHRRPPVVACDAFPRRRGHRRVHRRHRRAGHLFQNWYNSVVVEEEPYFLELVRYLHLNPLRAGLVADLRALERYPWTGHAVLLGRREAPWQATRPILARFAPGLHRARARYRAFAAEGVRQGRRPDVQGGGLLRRLGGWEAVRALRRGREAFTADERIPGSPAFVARLHQAVEAAPTARARWRRVSRDGVIQEVCAAAELTPDTLVGGGRAPAATQARDGIAYLWVQVLGRSGRRVAVGLGVRPESLYKAATRGVAEAPRWRRVLARIV